MGVILAILFTGITLLAYWYGVAPNDKETVISQITSNIFGRNYFYYFIQGITALILVLAANTGFTAFPLLAYNLASDKYLPRMYLMRGDRLGYSNGIITLGVASILLIIAFKGHTGNLIPLYAVGVFLPFTLSQIGMIIKWLREKPNGWLVKLIINSLGAIITLTVLLIFFITKFQKVWPLLFFLPMIVLIFHRIYKHYNTVGEQLRINSNEVPQKIEGNIVIVPIAGITKVVEQSINYAESIGVTVIAIYVAFDKESEMKMKEKWREWKPNIRLITVVSPYRSLIRPITKVVSTIQDKTKQNGYSVTVLIPQFIVKKRWHYFLHNQSGVLLRMYLLYKKNTIVSTIPYQLKK